MVKKSDWTITDLKPSGGPVDPRTFDKHLTVRPLPKIAGYGFPIKLTASLSNDDPAIWFTLHLTIKFDGDEWPELVEETRRRKPDWIRDPDGNVIAWRPSPAGQDILVPIQRTILRNVIATCTVPLDNPHQSQFGRSYTTIHRQLPRPRKKQITDSRLYEIGDQYLDAWADPTLTEGQRRDYVARQLGYERSDTTIRTAISRLKQTERIQQPHWQLPITASKISYRLRPELDINHLSFGGDPLFQLDPGIDYTETDWKHIRQIVRHKEIEYDVLENHRH